MSIPAELKYVESHEWVSINGDIATVGITDFAQDQLGDVTFVDLPSVGSIIKEEDEIGAIESVKAASDLYSPVAGEIIEVNTTLENSPELVNTSPYKDGWIIKVKLSKTPTKLLSADEYKAFAQ